MYSTGFRRRHGPPRRSPHSTLEQLRKERNRRVVPPTKEAEVLAAWTAKG